MSQFTAVTIEQFGNKAWKRNTNYAFAAQANILPVVAIELTKVASAMPLGFVQTENSFQLVVITSWQPGTNFFVSHNGFWIGEYLPAILCGYPFRLIKPQDREECILCIDEESGLVIEEGQGEPFYDSTGAPSQSVKDMLGFLAQVEQSRVATQAAVDALQEANLMQPWPISVQNGDNAVTSEGLFRVDETALNALPDEVFLTLRNTGALTVAYAQLLSMNQLSVLRTINQKKTQLQTQSMGDLQVGVGLGDFRLSLDDDAIKFNM